MIKIIANGYFRSGTTMTWELLKNNLKGYQCFYEPLHRSLALEITNEVAGRQRNKKFGHDLMESYTKLDEKTLRKLLLNHPNSTKYRFLDLQSLYNYLDIFNKMSDKVFLQTNTLHYFLDILNEQYDCKIIHIIRHPLSVYESITKSASSSPNRIRAGIETFVKKYFTQNMFGIKNEFNWILKRVGKPETYYQNPLIRLKFKMSLFEKFVVVWTVSNYQALKSVDQCNGFILVYEDFLKNPEKVTGRLSNYLGVKIKNNQCVNKTKLQSFKNIKHFKKVAKKFGLEKELNYILKTVQNQDVSY